MSESAHLDRAEARESIEAARELIRSGLAVAAMMLAVDEEFDVSGGAVAGIGAILHRALRAADARLITAETLLRDGAGGAESGEKTTA
jgi:hypothetical protein